MISWCAQTFRCTRCHNNDNPVDDMLMKRREFENDTGRQLAEVDLEVFRENMPRLINCIRCYQKHDFFNDEPVNTWIALEEAQILVHSNIIQNWVAENTAPLSTNIATMADYPMDFCEHIASDKLAEMIDKMREEKEVTVDEREKWVKRAIERQMIPAEFTSGHGRMMNILHSPIFRGVLSRTSGWLALQNSQEYPSEMAVYEWAGVWKKLVLWGNRSIKDGINFSSFIIRNIQKLLNGETSGGQGFHIHSGPWHFPFIGEKQRAFEEKYNVRIALITYEGDERDLEFYSNLRYLWIFPCNKPDTLLYLGYECNRYFSISMGSPSDCSKYEQMQLGITAKDETMKVTSEKINESTYKRIVAPESESGAYESKIWTANHRPTFDDINCFGYLKGNVNSQQGADVDWEIRSESLAAKGASSYQEEARERFFTSAGILSSVMFRNTMCSTTRGKKEASRLKVMSIPAVMRPNDVWQAMFPIRDQPYRRSAWNQLEYCAKEAADDKIGSAMTRIYSSQPSYGTRSQEHRV
ncbi:unnamed protein product, partial [Mesorhabditis spiculigera]